MFNFYHFDILAFFSAHDRLTASGFQQSLKSVAFASMIVETLIKIYVDKHVTDNT